MTTAVAFKLKDATSGNSPGITGLWHISVFLVIWNWILKKTGPAGKIAGHTILVKISSTDGN